jgi:hypothetical protein
MSGTSKHSLEPETDPDVERARVRVTHQIDVVLRLQRQGQDTHDARRLLDTYVEALELISETKRRKI